MFDIPPALASPTPKKACWGENRPCAFSLERISRSNRPPLAFQRVCRGPSPASGSIFSGGRFGESIFGMGVAISSPSSKLPSSKSPRLFFLADLPIKTHSPPASSQWILFISPEFGFAFRKPTGFPTAERHIIWRGPSPSGFWHFRIYRVTNGWGGNCGVHCGHLLAVFHGTTRAKAPGDGSLFLGEEAVVKRLSKNYKPLVDIVFSRNPKALGEARSAFSILKHWADPHRGPLCAPPSGKKHGGRCLFFLFPHWRAEKYLELGFFPFPRAYPSSCFVSQGPGSGFFSFFLAPHVCSCFSSPFG